VTRIRAAIGVTQRALPPNAFGERQDALDPRWHTFLAECGLVGVPLPNDPALAPCTARTLDLAGLLLTGGQNLARYGGDAARRDETEQALLAWAMSAHRPVFGVCRGMQLILDAFGSGLVPVDGHVAVEHEALIDGVPTTVNCYHRLAAVRVAEPLVVTGTRGDVVEAVRHRLAPVRGIMWHPERRTVGDPGRSAEASMFGRFFAEVPG
jgi:putative glutamine amidotransferase